MEQEIRLRYGPDGLIPAVVQDEATEQVLMVAYMDEEALQKTLETGESHFWSRSRKTLWKKGETSGHGQTVDELFVDCDEDTLLLKVRQTGPACHTGEKSCFFRRLRKDGREKESGKGMKSVRSCEVLDEVFEVIEDRRLHPKEDSYVSRLIGRGTDQVLKKVAEEAAEVIMAAKDRELDALTYEMADLWFHSLVALSVCGGSPQSVFEELRRRFGKSGIRMDSTEK